MPRATVIVLCGNNGTKRLPVTAVAIVGCFAVHRIPDVHPDLWFVSHTPTGMSASLKRGFAKVEDAKRLASLLSSLSEDWLEVRPGMTGALMTAAKRVIESVLRGDWAEAERRVASYSSLGRVT